MSFSVFSPCMVSYCVHVTSVHRILVRALYLSKCLVRSSMRRSFRWTRCSSLFTFICKICRQSNRTWQWTLHWCITTERNDQERWIFTTSLLVKAWYTKNMLHIFTKNHWLNLQYDRVRTRCQKYFLGWAIWDVGWTNITSGRIQKAVQRIWKRLETKCEHMCYGYIQIYITFLKNEMKLYKVI